MYMVQNPPKYDDVICEQPLNIEGEAAHILTNKCDIQTDTLTVASLLEIFN